MSSSDRPSLSHGELKYRYCNKILLHGFKLHDKLHGEYKNWDINGMLLKHCFFKHGKEHGECIMLVGCNGLNFYKRGLYENGNCVINLKNK